ncbi:hypothetical protein GCM10023093_00610 [Nemorincola caseinilytica]|uniref:histidine kinase n=1 Tax=Nemorincola caseinilytica TaxID=2054315 RepID=A0ABP8N441_9BACT
MLAKEINILHLEDEVMDAYLVKKILDRAMLNFNITVICDKESFINALHAGTYDIILADHSMPNFTAMDALHILKEKNIDLPLILVTGTVSEEYSVNAMKEGAWDYVLKDRLQRLPSAVTSALERYEATLDKKRHIKEIFAKEALMKEAERLARFGSWQADLVNGHSAWSDEKYRILGYEPEAVAPTFENFMARVHPDDVAHVKQVHEHAFSHLNNMKYECRMLIAQGVIKYIRCEMVIKRDTDGNITALTGIIRDITESQEAKQRLSENENKYKCLFAYSPQPMWVIEEGSSRFLDVNKAAMAHYGYSYEEFMSMTAADIRPITERNSFMEVFMAAKSEERSNRGVWKHQKKDGTLIDVEIMASSVMFDGMAARLILLYDVTKAAVTA